MSRLIPIVMKRASRLRGEEEGVVALLTFLFIATVGIVCLFLLWGLAYTSGAYTTLYGAAQAAAYASASEIQFNAQNAGEQSTAQPPFDCQDGFDSATYGTSPDCTGGNTLSAASSLLQNTLNGQYGLTYLPGNAGSVKLDDASGNASNEVLAYEIGMPPGAAYAADRGCAGFTTNGADTDLVRTCWKNPLAGAGGSEVSYPNYVSGVVVVLSADIPFFPHCNLPLVCPTEHLRVAVSARSGQQQPFSGINSP